MKFPKIDLCHIFIITSILSLAFVYSFLWINMITTPEQYTATDFMAFYAAGRISRNEGPSRVYDLALQQKYEEQVVGFKIPIQQVNPFPHPPFVIPLTQMVSSSNYVLSNILWNAIMGMFFLLGAIPLMHLVKQLEPSRQQGIIMLAGILLFFPSFESIVNGQNSAMLFLGTSLWMFGILTNQDWLSGLGLSATAVRPHITLLLAVPFIFKRQKVWWWFVAGAIVLAIFSLAYAGITGVEGFLRILFISGSGESYHINEANMVNFLALALRLFPFVPSHIIRPISWVIYVAALIGLCILWRRAEDIKEKHIGAAVMMGIFTAPHLHFHDLVLLMAPLLGLILLLVRGKYWKIQCAMLLPLGVSILLLISIYSDFLLHSIHYLVELFLIWGLLCPDKISIRGDPTAEKQSEAN